MIEHLCFLINTSVPIQVIAVGPFLREWIVRLRAFKQAPTTALLKDIHYIRNANLFMCYEFAEETKEYHGHYSLLDIISQLILFKRVEVVAHARKLLSLYEKVDTNVLNGMTPAQLIYNLIAHI